MLVAALGVQGAGNCSQAEPKMMKIGRQQYTFYGLGVLLRPVLGGKVSPEYYVQWDLATLVERNRTLVDIHGRKLETSRCVSPSAFAVFDPQNAPDPLLPYEPEIGCPGNGEMPCGPVLGFMNATDFDCWVEAAENQPFHGVLRSSVYAHYSHPLYPGFRLTAGFHFVNQSVTVYPIEGSNLTNEYRYAKSKKKKKALAQLPPASPFLFFDLPHLHSLTLLLLQRGIAEDHIRAGWNAMARPRDGSGGSEERPLLA